MDGLKIRAVGLLAGLFLAGCAERGKPVAPAAEQAGQPPSAYDPATTGEVRGQLTWHGNRPRVLPYQAPLSPLSEQPGGAWRDWPNPHAPQIDERTRGVAGAVISLHGIDRQRAKPWDHPPVRVEIHDYQLHVCQGEQMGKVGFVQRGQTVEMVSREPVFHSLQARGADFFARTLPQPDRPCHPRLNQCGVVELRSGAGHFWMRGYLFVDDHPYYTLTDREGRFTLTRIPPGRYQLVCWLPSWKEAEHELDADTVLLTRLEYRPPVQLLRTIDIAASQARTVTLQLGAGDFPPAQSEPISRSPQIPVP